MAEERIAALAIEFIVFCFNRRSVEWPKLYDEMCYVAGNRLYKGLGYEELREAGLDFTLSESITGSISYHYAHSNTETRNEAKAGVNIRF